MGTWGSELYQDDLAQETKDSFQDLLKKGKTTLEATEQLIRQNADVLNDVEEAPIFWFALADTQWELGRLLQDVKEKAIQEMDKGIDQTKWQDENPEQAVDRKRVLEELRQKLNSSMPPEKNIQQNKLYKCAWKVGDLFVCKLDSELAKEKGLSGRYLLIHKVDEGVWYPGHITPIIRAKITHGTVLPNNRLDIESAEYIQTSLTKYEDRFLPWDNLRSMEEQIAEKSKRNYVVDEFGFLPHYRVQLIITSKRSIPKSLIYIGNYKDIATPMNEFVPHSKLNISSCTLKNLQSYLIDRYCGYNLRQYELYKGF